MTRRLLVGPTTATRLPGDEPRVVTATEAGGLQAGAGEPGRWIVPAAAPPAERPPVTVFTGPPRRDRDGSTVVEVVVDGWRFELEVEDADRAELRRRATRAPDAAAASGPTEIRAIIPGRVAAVRVVVGDAVEAGQGLLVVEAMKMQNELRAPRAGIVERVAVADGQTIDNGDVLVVLR